ncbi:phage tail tape measure protein [Streptomyces shenzhenensis]|uniref:phage tail tape measure protein n=1 Tax=Streptomyces shenzhenensis TaxID=943815 RepID=UPI003D8CAE27
MATLEELLVAVGINTDDLTAGADGAADRVESSLGGIQTAAAGAAVGAMFVAGLDAAMDLQAVQTDLKTQFGLTEQEAARAGDAAGRVYAAGWGESMQEVGDALGVVTQAMGGLGEMSDATLDDLTKKAMLLGEKFELDVAESANAAGKMIKLGMAKDGEEAFDILTQAAATLPKMMRDDIPKVIEEYGKHFERMGIDGKTAFGMMSQYVQAGGRDIDQAADVVHEFARITSEETDRAKAAFKALGLDSGQMLTDISKGGDDAEAALGKTLEALRGVKDPAQQAALGVELFGDMAGEGADALWAMDPATAAAASGMDKAAGAADRAVQAAEASKSLEAIWRTMAVTLGEMLQPALAFLSDFMQKNPGLVQILAIALLALGTAISLAVIAQWAWNTALWAFPGTWIIAAIIAVIAAAVLLWKNWDTVVQKLKVAWDFTVAVFRAGWNALKTNVFAPIGQFFTSTIPHWVGTGVLYVMNKWNSMINWFRGIPGRIGRALSGTFDGLKSAFRNAVNWIISRWNGLSFTIGGGSFMGVSIPSMTISTPNIPYLADGGITTGPTLAMIGEGTEDEAVLPLSKLDNMLNAARVSSVRSNASDQVLRVDVTGTDQEMKKLLRKMFRTDGRGFALDQEGSP